MISLTWAEINDGNFVQAIMALGRSKDLDAKNAYRVSRIIQTATKQMEKARDATEAIKKEFAFKNDKGEVSLDEKGQVVWNGPDGEKNYDAAVNKLFTETSIEIKVHKIDFAALRNVTAIELMSLDKILQGQPEEE